MIDAINTDTATTCPKLAYRIEKIGVEAPRGANTEYLDDHALETARKCACGSYQESLIEGEARWSGADLRGKASRYGGRYAASREALLRRFRDAGLDFVIRRGNAHEGPLLVIVWRR